ncbi:hypothetical protein GCM10023196_007310 [Actinoallomurus vinaceus]|uniref:Uncharacterized protein n=1 Tax=Actinoallomurus vinaceus TaxID=1080074 RepID=A0ABP8U4K1_9ACTN
MQLKGGVRDERSTPSDGGTRCRPRIGPADVAIWYVHGGNTKEWAHGRDEFSLHRIWGARSPENAISDRLMQKLGMVVEVRIRGRLLVSGRRRDSIVHSILEEEWAAQGQ